MVAPNEALLFLCINHKSKHVYIRNKETSILNDWRNGSEGVLVAWGCFQLLTAMDYRCEAGRFPAFESCVTISNHNSLSNSETGFDPGIIRS
jgi:hypothetical protein